MWRTCMLGAVAVAVAAFTTSAARADVITTVPAWDGNMAIATMGAPGAGAATTVGQTFTAGGAGFNVLTSFTFYARDNVANPGFNYVAQVYAWNGTAVTGPALFAGGAQSQAGLAFVPITTNTGNLALTTGQQYVALFTSIGFADNGAKALFGSVSDSAYAGGTQVYNDYSSTASFNSPSRWNYGGNLGDLTFTLNFANAVPEPSPVALAVVASAVCGVPVLVRRARKGRAVA